MNQNRGTGRHTEEDMRERRRQIRAREYAEKVSRDRENVQLIYILYLGNFILALSVIVGLVMAYAERGNSEPWLESHYTWLIRTFWIGLLYIVISLFLFFVVVGAIMLFMTMVWFLIRMVRGLQALNANRPIDNPYAWIF